MFPLKTIEWNDHQWTISGVVGGTIKKRFTNDNVQQCPPRDGWIYWGDDVFKGSNSDMKVDVSKSDPMEKNQEFTCAPSVVVTNSTAEHSSLDYPLIFT